MESFDPVTRQAVEITNLFNAELVVSALLLALVLSWLVLAVVRFRARPGDNTEPPQVYGNPRLELAWTIAPAVTLGIVFIVVVVTMRSVDAIPNGAQQVRVVGHQWWWEFQYPDLGVVTANELHVPVGTPLQMNLDSVDVIHSFWVPRFGMMRDAVPGRTNQMSIFVQRAGIFDGSCTQYCGRQHAWMRIRIVAEPREQFDAWAVQQAGPATLAGAPGQELFVQNTCVNCHTIRGVSAANVGPDLTHLGSRVTLGAGVIDNTPDNLRRWIRDASSIKPGVLMPAFADLSEAELNALVDYLDGLL
ncbi:MAG TPA: cytochrome c oxidase subunit II [Chloroflexota bacterium]|nr:cytochrome c oxidase subunit II [Chloroflexota bacterium]